MLFGFLLNHDKRYDDSYNMIDVLALLVYDEKAGKHTFADIIFYLSRPHLDALKTSLRRP